MSNPTAPQSLPVEPVNPEDAVAFFWAVFDCFMAHPGAGGWRVTELLGLGPEHRSAVQNILDSANFRKLVLDAQRDLAASVVDRFKRNAHRFADRMENIALMSNDIRSAVTALKDLLDRAETGGARKVSITTPSAYKRIVEELAEKPDEKVDDPTGSEPAPPSSEAEPSAPAAT